MSNYLVPGKKYRIVTQSESQRYPRISVGVLLEEKTQCLFMDFRPIAGTSQVPVSWIKQIAYVSDETEVIVNKRDSTV